MVATTPPNILRFLAARADEGVDCVLITLVAVIGGSSRGVGTQMAVAADGRRIGSFSGGCVEDAVASEALETLKDGWGHVVRYGVGSPYIDIRLPCGGGIDLLFTPRPDPAAIKAALALLDSRKPATLRLECDCVTLLPDLSSGSWNGETLSHSYQPPLHIHALGQGEDLTAFTKLANAFGAQVHALCPEALTCAELEATGIATSHIATRTTLPLAASDPWSAIIFLFHGRDWEEHLLPQALALPAFYHGAIGSRRTHAARLEALRNSGVPEDHIARLRGHIGLIPATRDPATLALSVLGEVVAEYNALSQWTYWTGAALADAAQ
ncbi:XdhC family protein [Novosphingobium jiangmenense]|uniref:XdhC family protein n=1 Tax=Novosphingobium jiangmenense TaxID=2791981 RepID=A0ABS0HGX5_9SPHN|nr:XdhC family protein [Novosphingobium jiangmenense]MBF9151501.1 XdhC family protein [Novosphingobium jiangmenense]